ncbi:hypothetical protein CCAE64S_02656 [Castellaniella caeni]
MNREHAYLRAIFNELHRIRLWDRENSLAGLRLIPVQEAELSYLGKKEVFSVLASLNQAQNPHVLLVAKICLSIGARWSEAEGLKRSQEFGRRRKL